MLGLLKGGSTTVVFLYALWRTTALLRAATARVRGVGVTRRVAVRLLGASALFCGLCSSAGAQIPTPIPVSTPVSAACTGDCDGGGDVAVNELIIMVNVALGNQSMSACVAGDKNGDGQISIEEIIGGVNAALNGCGGPGRPTPTPRPGCQADAECSSSYPYCGPDQRCWTKPCSDVCSDGAGCCGGSYPYCGPDQQCWTQPCATLCGTKCCAPTQQCQANGTCSSPQATATRPPTGTVIPSAGPQPTSTPQSSVTPGPAPTDEMSAVIPVSPGQPTHVELSDGTVVDLPAVTDPGGPPDTPFTRVQVSRQSSDVDLLGSDVMPIGTMRVLSFEPFDQNAFANNDNLGVGRLHAADFIPTITLPKSTLGTADLEAVTAVARVGDIYVDGRLEPDAVRFLPAFYDDAGNLQVRDIYFPQSILSDLEERAATTLFYRAAALRLRRVRYVPASLLTSLNWSKEPKLVRMIPKASSTANRVPLDKLAQTDPEQAQTELRRCVNNIVVLVHGHNEEEKGGFLPPNIEAPWDYAYKRDVWTLFYDYVLKNDPKARLGCTAFYEFIYPSYRPVITPYGGVKRLDEGFAEELGKELKPFLDSGDDYRLYVVAHSMGGIVSRAGVQVMDAKLDGWLKKLVTWGSPHMGSALPSLAFALAAAPPYALHTPPGWKPAGIIDISGIDALYELLIEAISSVQLPAPGPREYRWARSSTSTPYEIRLQNVLALSEAQDNPVLRYHFNFTDGSWLYNDNLRLLNAYDRHAHDGTYATLFGLTTKRPAWKATPFGFISYPSTTQTGIGAAAIELLMDPTPLVVGLESNASDGAVPVASMIAAGVADYFYYLGDVDHEEYYGAPDATGAVTAEGEDNAAYTAQSTLAVLKVLSDDVACPSFTFTKEPPLSFGPTDTIEVAGALVWPGDQTPGSRIASLTVEADHNIGQLAVLAFRPDGTFSGSFPASGLPISTNFMLTLLAKLKDNTELKKTWIRGVAVPIVSYFRGGPGLQMITEGDQGTWIDIGGSGFGATMLPSSSVAFGGVKAEVNMNYGRPHWEDTSILVMVPFVGKGVVPVTVTVGGVTSAPRDFTVTDTWADTLQSSTNARAKCWQDVVEVPITWSGFSFQGTTNTTLATGWTEVELKGTIDRNTKTLTKLEARRYEQYQLAAVGSRRAQLDFVFENLPIGAGGVEIYGVGAFTYLASYRAFEENIDVHGVVSTGTTTKATLEAVPGLPPLMQISIGFGQGSSSRARGRVAGAITKGHHPQIRSSSHAHQ